MQKNTDGWPAVCLAFLVCFPGFVFGQELKDSGNKKVILIIIDALRPDHLGCYGYGLATSPAIDALAEESFVFENAFSQSCYTLPSHASIFTSLYPKSHGVFDVFKDVLPRRIPTIAELFKSNGFATAWFSLLHHPHLDIDIGFGRGFDVTGELNERLDERGHIFEWIKNHKDRGFFLAMNARSVHNPYSPEQRYKNKFLKGRKNKIIETKGELEREAYPAIQEFARGILSEKVIAQNRDLLFGLYKKDYQRRIEALLPPDKKFAVSNIQKHFYFSHIDPRNKEGVEYLCSLYDACILETDRKLIKAMVDFLKKFGIYDSTMIIITADHGEEFGEHGGLGHEFKLYDELVHVPLIIKVPGYRGGVRIRGLAGSIDIAPTMCDYAGIITPQYMQGMSLMPLLRVDTRGAVNEFVSGENPQEAYIRSEEWKLIVPHDPAARRYLFNLKLDPQEKNNLYNEAVSSSEQGLLETRLRELRRSLPLYQEGESLFLPKVTPEMRERIKKTGYW